jgi:plastocyanin
MTFRSILLAGALALTPGAAWAGDLVVSVVTNDGKPLANAVVTLPAAPGAPKPAFPWKLEIAQKDKQFEPFVLIAPVGARVGFPNLDKFRHHVYSFSKGNKFELELYGREDKRSVPFNAVGVAALGCNIHDEMAAFVRIVDTPWAAKSGADGVAEIKAAPEGKAKLTVWHPYAKAKDQSVSIETTIASGATHVTVSIDILPSPHH